jgi:sulfur-oxidizing protein SoxX
MRRPLLITAGRLRRIGALLCCAVLVGCATAPSDVEVSRQAATVLKGSFKANGQATMDRLDQDETQRLCTQYANKALPKDVAEMIEKLNLASIKWPADGKYLGSWQEGEKIAQRGTGFQWSDTKETPVGGNCYACHQLTKAEISYGTIGPSLYNFGKTRGYGVEMQRYAYGKVWNSDAYNACSTMPRFGHMGVLTEAQVRDVVALLMDPNSPVNK